MTPDRNRTLTPSPGSSRLRAVVAGGALVLALTAVPTACSARPLTPDQRAVIDRLETVEGILGRHGVTDDFPYLETLRAEAASLDLPVAEARARLILGRSVASDLTKAHLQLAAEAFHEHDEASWEARAWLALARELNRVHLDDRLFASDRRDEAVRALERSVRLARQADDPLTEAEAHWVLGSLRRIEDARGPAIEQLELAAEAFEKAGEPLLVVAARIEVARAYHSLGDLPQAESILKVAVAELEGEIRFAELRRLQDELQEARSDTDPAKDLRRMAEGLRQRALPELADHMERVAEFFAERGDRLQREGWSREDAEAMAKIQSQAPRPRIEPLQPVQRTRLGAAITTPLPRYLSENPDQALVRRALRFALDDEIGELDRTIRRLRLDRLLAGESEALGEQRFARLLAHAEETGYMPDLPVEWFVRQIEAAPRKYHEENALPTWVELRAADLYFRLGRRVEGFEGIPPEDDGSLYRPVNAWQSRYCARLKAALEKVGRPEQFRCDLRNSFGAYAGRFTHSVHLDDPYVARGSRIDALEEKRRRLVALREDPSRLESEIEAGVLSDVLDGLFYLHRNPSMAVGMAAINAPLRTLVAVREIGNEAVETERARETERRFGEVECGLSQQRTLHLWLAQLASAHGYRQEEASHRQWVAKLDAEQREQMKPSGLVSVGSSSDFEPVWGLGCGGRDDSFVDSRHADDRSSEPREPLATALESLDAGRYRKALRLLRSFEQVGVDRPELRAAMLDGLGRAYLGLGDRRRALDAFRRSVDALEEVVGSFHRASLLATYAARASETYNRVIELLAAEGHAREAFEYAERARARGFLHRLGSAPVAPAGREDVPEVLRQAANDLRRRILRLENLRDHPSLVPTSRADEAGGSARAIESQLAAVRREYVRVLRRISGAGATATQADAAGVDEVQELLVRSGSVLVEYHLLADHGLAWILDGDSVHQVEIDAGADRLGDLVDLFRDEIADLRPYRRPAGVLYETLITPVLPYLNGRSTIVAPHGPLHHLPFGALWHEATGRHLAEELVWTTVPSASSLRLLGAGNAAAPAHPLVVGDPDGTLPAARQSARQVARILDADPLLGDDATERALRGRVSEADLLHVGTHAVFDDADPMFSRLVLASESDKAARREDDGRLELYEIYDLDLRHVDLVTLSACQTAVGLRTSGDDVTTLQRAFLASGASHVVSTLWSIEDEAAAAWSAAFYRRLAAGQPVAAALVAAQREVMAEETWRHPYFWAAFVASGVGPEA